MLQRVHTGTLTGEGPHSVWGCGRHLLIKQQAARLAVSSCVIQHSQQEAA